ncbi:hypothetical protein EDB80DRAFT_200700 [Ilyonectria destructans]|nr:hypothetical protein EDB80DRAFT_200700 [Ilyonectria destructans]
MTRRQRNPNRHCLEGTEFDKSLSSFLAPQQRHPTTKAEQEVRDDGTVTERSTESVAECQEISSNAMTCLGLYQALRSEGQDPFLARATVEQGSKLDCSEISVEKKRLLDKHLTRDRKWRTLHSPTRHSSKLPPRPTTPSTLAKTKPRRDERNIKGVCMWGEDGWQGVIAKIDPDAEESILDTRTASALRLTLRPMPRQKAKRVLLANSEDSHPQYWAENVRLKVADIPPLSVNITVARVSCEPANVVIGRQLLKLLEDMENRSATGSPQPTWGDMSREIFPISGTGNLQSEGDALYPLVSASTNSEFSLSSFSGDFASVYTGDGSYNTSVGEISANPRLWRIEDMPADGTMLTDSCVSLERTYTGNYAGI